MEIKEVASGKFETLAQAGKRTGLSRRTILDRCNLGQWPGAKRAGEGKTSPWIVPAHSLPVRSSHLGRKTFKEQNNSGETSLLPKIVQMKDDGMRNVDIARYLNVDPSYVTHALRRDRERKAAAVA